MTQPVPPIVCDTALLPDGWARDVRITIGGDGMIDEVAIGADAAGATSLPGFVIPGMPNLRPWAVAHSGCWPTP